MKALSRLLSQVEGVVREKVIHAASLTGGDISRAFLLTGESGRRWFLKTNDHPTAPLMFRREAQGLALLGAAQVIRTPRVYGCGEDGLGEAFLVLSYVESGPRSPLFWERFGRALAALHGQTSAFFGLAHDNFIGSLPQSNRRHPQWSAFYAQERLRPQMRLARENGLLEAEAEKQLERLCTRLDDLCPEEAPALIHGDLWGGNFLCDTAGEPVLIDPAVAYAHREMDLAMSRLFGGFEPVFYAAYEEVWPLEPGFEQRVAIYQLYYLLVHVNLFGGSYVGQVRAILNRWR